MNKKILNICYKFNIKNKALALAMCFIIMFIFIFIGTSYTHTLKCHNYNCNMCETIENAHVIENFLFLPFLCYGLLTMVSFMLKSNISTLNVISNTLVSQKVRLDN